MTFTTLFDLASASLVGECLSMTVKHVSSDANSPTFEFVCGVQMKGLKKDR